MARPFFRTVTGDVPVASLDLVLPHEHLFTDRRGPEKAGYAQEDPELVSKMMAPYLRQAEEAGVTALFECSPVGIGRNIGILTKLAFETEIKIIAPTGIFSDKFTPEFFKHKSVDNLIQLWTEEIETGIGFTDHKAGFIMIAISEDGPTGVEERNIQAAAKVSLATGAAVASYTPKGETALLELEILKTAGLTPSKLIWLHANEEQDPKYHFQMADQGAYVEFDCLGRPCNPPDPICDGIEGLVGKGLAEHILLSQGAGAFQPGVPSGIPENGIRGYTDLVNDLIPNLQSRGLDLATINLITKDNPKQAFALN